jgi:hypothetical protein
VPATSVSLVVGNVAFDAPGLPLTTPTFQSASEMPEFLEAALASVGGRRCETPARQASVNLSKGRRKGAVTLTGRLSLQLVSRSPPAVSGATIDTSSLMTLRFTRAQSPPAVRLRRGRCPAYHEVSRSARRPRCSGVSLFAQRSGLFVCNVQSRPDIHGIERRSPIRQEARCLARGQR